MFYITKQITVLLIRLGTEITDFVIQLA
jgi:hypothetical protein